MDPKGRLSSQIHFSVPLGITYSDSLHCGNTLDQIYWYANQIKNYEKNNFSNSFRSFPSGNCAGSTGFFDPWR